jgi:hypothetical protein
MRERKRDRMAAWMAGPVFSAGLLLGLSAPLIAQPSTTAPGSDQDRALVEGLVPQQVLDEEADESGQTGLPLSERCGFIAVDLSGTGHPDFLVAVYVTTDAGLAELRVLKKTNGSAVPVQDFHLCRGGSQPKVSLLNLDQASTPEILVELGGRGQAIDWVFKWNGTALVSFGPGGPYHGSPCTDLQDASFVDLDGDGILEIVNEPEYLPGQEKSDAPRTYQVYKLVDGTYTPSGVFEFFAGYAPPGPPVRLRTRGFSASTPESGYVMTIANGDGRDEPPVQSAKIRLNGEVVPGTETISRKVRYLKIPVTVQADNEIYVSVTGPAGSALYVGIGPAQPDSQTTGTQ